MGRGGGCQVVRVLAFYSDDPSSNLAEAYRFFFKVVFEKNKNKEKEAGYDPLKIPFPLARVISFFSFHISYWP